MKTYIERAAAMDAILGLTIADPAVAQYANAVYYNLQNLPAADVVEVTFCKDCRYYPDAKVNEKGFLICPASGMEITETDYCSYGERKIETVLPKSDAKDESLGAAHEISE